MPLVSIIVPNYNHVQYLEARISSIFNQTFTDYEVILLDGCSNDGSIELLNEFAKDSCVKMLIRSGTNSGNPFVQWKTGIDKASGEYIWIAESDDYCKRDFLELSMNVLRNNPNVGIIYSASQCVDSNNQSLEKPLQINEENQVLEGVGVIKKYMLFENFLPNSSAVIFRKEIVQQKDWDDVIKCAWCGDWVFWIKLLERTSLWFIPEDLNFFRKHAESTSSRYALKAYDIKEAFPIVLEYSGRLPGKISNLYKTFLHWSRKLELRKRNAGNQRIPLFRPFLPNCILHVVGRTYRMYMGLKSIFRNSQS